MKKIALFFASALLSACGSDFMVDSDNGDNYFEDEENCYCTITEEPSKALVTFRVTLNDENPEVNIDIYEGAMSDSVIVKTLIAKEKRIEDSLAFGDYTYAVKYKKGDKNIIVPIKTKLDFNCQECNGYECYEILNNVVDLSLKF